MTRLLTTGFETGDTSDVVNYSVVGLAVVTSPVRTGGYSLRLLGNDYWANLRSFSGTDVVYLGVGLYTNTLIQAGKALGLLDIAGTPLLTVGWNSTGRITAYTGDFSGLLATSTNQIITLAGYYYFEVYGYVNDSGHMTVKVDGVQVIDYSGDTKALTNVDMYTLRLYSYFSGPSYHYYDDIVVNDDAGSDNNTWPGQVKLLPFRPTGAGDNTGLSRGGTDSGANWSQVEEVPASSSDYVYDTVVDEYDLYAAADPSIPTGATIKNVIVTAHAAYDSGGGNIAPMMKSSSTTAQSSDQALSSSYKPYDYCRALDPNGDIAWTASAINSLQIGVKVR